jgi:hypothetical protein
MRLKLCRFGIVEIWADVSADRSCGESRSDWRLVHRCTLKSLLRYVYALATGEAVEAHL